MTDHLSIMGVQRWQQRNKSNTANAVTAKTNTTASNLLFSSPENSRQLNEPLNKSKNIESNAFVAKSLVEATATEKFSAYAATSTRSDSSGQIKRWLWVLPQSAFPGQEIQLLDKILSATGSNWESSPLADNYLNETAIADVLTNNISALIILSDESTSNAFKDVFENHQLLDVDNYVVTGFLGSMLTNLEEKQSVWKKLKQIMM